MGRTFATSVWQDQLKKGSTTYQQANNDSENVSFFTKKRKAQNLHQANNTLGTMKMINIGLINGIDLPRWKRCVDIMIEKAKGVSKIHRLRIIQLFEADFSFCLKTIFGDRLMRFVLKYCSMNAIQYGSKRGHLCHSTVIVELQCT